MTIPEERLRALLWAGGLLIEIANDVSVPLPVRRRAVVIARHFPTVEELSRAAQQEGPFGSALEVASPERILEWSESLRFGPLRDSTRLALISESD